MAEVIKGPALPQEVTALVPKAQALAVKDEPSAKLAADLRESIKDARKVIADWFEPRKKAAHQIHKDICDAEKLVDKPYAAAEEAIARDLKSYLEAEEKRQAALRVQQVETAVALGADTEEVQGIMAAPAQKPDVGVGLRKKWKVSVPMPRLVNLVKFAAFIVANPSMASMLTVDEEQALYHHKINDHKLTVPGLEFRQESGLASRR